MAEMGAFPEYNYLQEPAVIAVDWIGFLCLSGSTLYLIYKLMHFKGADGDHMYHFGYKESKMLSVFVILFTAISYWAKICSHVNGDVGPAAEVVTYKYIDYVFTCPLLTIDLMWSLNLPYKFFYGGVVFVCIVCALCSSTVPPPARYLWFGMGMLLFSFAWVSILSLVRERLQQMKHPRIKKARGYVQVASITYFVICLGYPLHWIVDQVQDLQVVGPVPSHILHVLFDVLTKSIYAFALLLFLLCGEKMDFMFLALRPSVEKVELNVYNADLDDDSNGNNNSAMQSTMIGSRSAVNKIKANTAASIFDTESSRDDWGRVPLPDGLSFRSQSDFPPHATNFPTFDTEGPQDYNHLPSNYIPRSSTGSGYDSERAGLDMELGDTEHQIRLLNATLSGIMKQQDQTDRRI